MLNKVFIGDHEFINVVFGGNQTYDSIMGVGEQMTNFSQQLSKLHKPVKIIVNVQKIGYTDLGARKAANKVVTGMNFQKIAVYGGNYFFKHVVQLIIKGIGMKKIKNFSRENEAVNWLCS